MRPLRCVFYAINGTGLGHITRQCNIARDMRRVLERLEIVPNFEVLTTSDAPQVANDLLVSKLPSKTTVKSLPGISSRRYRDRARLQVANYMSQVLPDILVVDTDPRGSFGEIGFLTSFVKKLVFVDRAKDKKVLERKSYSAHERLYDLVLAPEESLGGDITCVVDSERNAHAVGKIQGFLPESALCPAEVRKTFGVSPSERLFYLSAGGGGDSTADRTIHSALEVLAEIPNSVTVVGYGPLFKGEICYHRRNVIPLQTCNVSQYFAGFDLAVSAGGYNSHEELLAACVPTLFYAQAKGMDRQDLRIADSRDRGWCAWIQDWDPTALRQQVAYFLETQSALVRDRLLKRSFPLGNLRAAQHILSVILQESPFDVSADVIGDVVQEIATERVRARADLYSSLQPKAA